jgi:hypothetical protein
VVSFKNAIIILTSNLGSANILEMALALEGDDAAAKEAIKNLVMTQVREAQRPGNLVAASMSYLAGKTRFVDDMHSGESAEYGMRRAHML